MKGKTYVQKKKNVNNIENDRKRSRAEKKRMKRHEKSHAQKKN